MSLPADQVLISADDHLDIHAMPVDVWSTRLPTSWRDRGPRVEETPDGPYWVCDGQRISPSGRKEKGGSAAALRPAGQGGRARRPVCDLARPGDPRERALGPTLYPSIVIALTL